jgi:glycerophosphoryl diester phosphodiesterase
MNRLARSVALNLALLVFLCIPTISLARHVDIYGHRGARGLWPENTLYAYQQVLKLGITRLDFDVHLTQDGVLVVTHDDALNPDITRDVNGHWITNTIWINQLRAKQLAQYNVCGIKPGSVYARLFFSQRGPAFCAIPRLDEVVKWVQKHYPLRPIRYQIELKTDPANPSHTASPQQLAQAVVDLVHHFNIATLVEIQSFDFRCLAAVHRLDPSLATAYLTDRFLPLGQQPELIEWIAKQGGRFWEPEDISLSQADLIRAHALGLKVVVWTWPEQGTAVYDKARIRRLIAWGVDGIITDRPDLLKRELTHD